MRAYRVILFSNQWLPETRDPASTGVNRPYRLRKLYVQSRLRCVGLANVK